MTPPRSQAHETEAHRRRAARWKLIAMAVLLSLPVGIAYWAYSVAQPQGQLAYGELIQPARPVGDGIGTDASGKVVALSALKGQWLLISVQGSSCPLDCQQRLFLHGQLREMLGKDKDRVDSVWLVDDLAQTDKMSVLPGRGTWVLRVNQAVIAKWLGTSPNERLSDYLYVVDPMGNAMARFPAGFDGDGAKQIRKVLDRLLKASFAWDPPGR